MAGTLESIRAIVARAGNARVLHAELFCFCARHEQAVDEALQFGRPVYVAVHREVGDLLIRGERALSIAQVELGEAMDEATAIATAVGLLKALDEHHWADRERLSGDTVDLADGRGVLFAPPARAAWYEALPDAHRIKADKADRGRSFCANLELKWRLIVFGDDQRPVAAEYRRLPAPVDRALAARWCTLRIGLVAPFGDVPPQWVETAEFHDGRGGVRLAGYRDPDAATASLQGVLADAATAAVDVLVFPELSLDESNFNLVRSWLEAGGAGAPEMTVAGSRHTQRRDGRWVNRCTVLDRDGDVMWVHDKVLRYGSRGRRGGDLVEDIVLGESLRLIEASFARMASVICLDYLCDKALYALYHEADANLFWVPAMTPRLADFQARARQLAGSLHAITVVSNSAYDPRSGGLRGPDDPELGLVHVPVKNGAGLAPLERVNQIRVYELAYPPLTGIS